MTTAIDDWNWLDGVYAIWRGRYRILIVTLLAGVGTATVMLLMPRTYEAIVTVRVGRVMDKLLEDPVHAAASINSNTIAAGLNRSPQFAGHDIDALSAGISATASASPTNVPPFVTISAGGRSPSDASQLAKTVAGIVIEDHKGRYQQMMDRERRYREDLVGQIASMKAEITDIEGAVRAIREHPPVGAPGVLLMRAQLEEKQAALLNCMRELRDVDVNLAGHSEETRMVGDVVVPRSRMRPRRTLTTLAGAGSGALLAIFWVLASDGARRRAQAPRAGAAAS